MNLNPIIAILMNLFKTRSGRGILNFQKQKYPVQWAVKTEIILRKSAAEKSVSEVKKSKRFCYDKEALSIRISVLILAANAA